MAAVGFDMKFHYVLAGWEGSSSDPRVLHSALHREGKLIIPKDKYYVVDAGYANCYGFLAPIHGMRYHRSTYKTGLLPQNKYELFNYRHSSLRNVVERVFGVLKKRFTILRVAPPYDFNTQVKIVIACCILYNHIRDVEENDLDSDGDEEVNKENTPDAAPFEPWTFAGRSQREREECNQFRENLATQLWEDYNK